MADVRWLECERCGGEGETREYDAMAECVISFPCAYCECGLIRSVEPPLEIIPSGPKKRLAIRRRGSV